jgi:hypothetical protein
VDREYTIVDILRWLDELDFWKNGLHALTMEEELKMMTTEGLSQIWMAASKAKILDDKLKRKVNHTVSIDTRVITT